MCEGPPLGTVTDRHSDRRPANSQPKNLVNNGRPQSSATGVGATQPHQPNQEQYGNALHPSGDPHTATYPYQTQHPAYSNSFFSPYTAQHANSYMGGGNMGGGNMGGGYMGGYGNSYGSGYENYGSYTGGYARNPAFGMNPRQNYSSGPTLNGARQTSEMVVSGMHEAMSRFARVSSMIEDILRNLHLLFDALFGLGYSLGALRHEAGMWLAVKTGPAAFLAKLLRRASNVWRLLCLFFMSPLAGRFSPVALVLRILGLVPEDDPLELALEEIRRRGKAAPSPDAQTPGDSSSL